MSDDAYIHGTDPAEQARLARLGELTDEAFAQFVDVRPTDAVLDVGSGLGNLARRLAARVPAGEVWAVERSAEQLARAAGHAPPNVHFRQADAHALPFPDGRFDVAYCRYVLEHVADPLQVSREMYRVLKPGGRAFAQENNILVNTFDPECPAFDRLWERFARLQALLGGDALVGRRLYRLFRQAGFARVDLSIQPEVHHHGMPTFAAWVQNLIENVRPVEGQLVAHRLATSNEVREGLGELERLLHNDLASAWFYWNRAVGWKDV